MRCVCVVDSGCDLCNFVYVLFCCVAVIIERHITDRERSSGYYRLSAYYLAKTISELPLTFALPTLFIVISYPVADLRGFPQFCSTWASMMLASLVAQVSDVFVTPLPIFSICATN